MTSEVFNVDCMEYMRGIPDKAFDLVLGDPPYGLYASKPKKKTDAVKQKNGRVLTARCNDYGKKNWDAKIPPQTFFDELRRRFQHLLAGFGRARTCYPDRFHTNLPFRVLPLCQ